MQAQCVVGGAGGAGGDTVIGDSVVVKGEVGGYVQKLIPPFRLLISSDGNKSFFSFFIIVDFD